jgi:hypothetical protein
VRRRAEVDSPDGERYSVAVRRSNAIGYNPVGLVWSFVRWAWRFGRWTVEVNRHVPWAEYRTTMLPYAFHWYGSAMSQEAAGIEFERVVQAIRSGQWPDAAYNAR